MRVLFIDDEVYRYERMIETGYITSDAVHVDNGLKAIDAIVNDGPWDRIYFDHDLATFVDTTEITGNNVAKVLISMDWCPKSVIIHSTNPVGARNIFNTLCDEDYSYNHKICVSIYPFYRMMEHASHKSDRSS